MISKQEVLSVATTLGLLPTSIEKDYVLGWVLYGISQHPMLSEWFFKGGTCLKKCYFETYRFSEDLDFTVLNKALYNKNEIANALNDVADTVYEAAGINLKTREIEVQESINKKNKTTFIAKFTYSGPLGLPSRTQQRIKFDITDDEIIVDAPDMRTVFHSYSDAPHAPINVNCYSINEILAEKTRAIYERQGRARDVYDVVNISRNFREHIDVNLARYILKEKFKFKLLPEPTTELIFSQIDLNQLTANWDDQLAHQVQLLPPIESFYNELQQALSWWINLNAQEPILHSISDENNERILPRSDFPLLTTFQLKNLGRGNKITLASNILLDKIRYAARNRLCVEIEYHGINRIIEAYSMRKTATRNVLLYAFELKRNNVVSDSIKAYKIGDITNAVITQQSFIPRYNVEL